MENQFEEISSMLDKVVGGKSLFSIDTTLNSVEKCITICTDNCSYGIGTVTGDRTGTIGPDEPIVRP